MDADDLGNGFRLGEWHVDPRERRVSGPLGVRALRDSHVKLLLVLARHHGEAVDAAALARAVAPGEWPPGESGEQVVAEQLRELAGILGDVAAHPRYIVAVGDDAYALIAHFEPVAEPLSPEASAGPQGSSAADVVPRANTGVVQRVQWLVAELRRRSVFKVCGAYLISMWITLQVTQVTLEPLRLPGWWMTALTILAVIGLPIVAILAWSYEITPGGIELDASGAGTSRMRIPRARRAIAPVAVAGVALMAAITGLAWWRSIESTPPTAALVSTAPAAVGPPSIAVLPLVDMSPAGGNAYLGDGLSEELSTRLAQVPGLRVAARTSAFEFKGRSLDVRKIGESLGVRHVLEGSVRRNGDDVRVSVQLIDTTTGYHVWVGNFDRAWRDVLDLQDDIAMSVTDALQIVLTESDPRQEVTPAHQVDARAIDPYLAGLAILRQPGDLSRLQQAEASFKQAIEIDAEFAGAYAGLCRTYAREFDRTRDPAPLNAAKEVCRKSLALDPALIETEKALASMALSAGKFESAASVYTRLIERNPADADGHIGLGDALSGLGKGAEAEACFRRAVAVEPAYWGAYSALATHLFARGKVDEASAALRKVTELVPSSAYAWSNLGATLQMKGDFDGALQAYQKSLQLEPSQDAYSNLATTYFYLDRFPEAVANYERAATLGEHNFSIQGNLADALWQVAGRRDDAIARYRRAIQLAEAELATKPSDPTIKAQLGYFYGRVGESKRSQQYLADALAADPEILYVQYFAGVAAADKGDREAALRIVAELVRMGYPPALLRSAPEFRSLRQDAEYKRIVGVG